VALALNNAQGELHPLEVGLHALGFIEAGGTARSYAEHLGDRKKEDSIGLRVHAAKVVRHVSDGQDHRDRWRHLAEIHAAPR
jgi:hypothetical protein